MNVAELLAAARRAAEKGEAIYIAPVTKLEAGKILWLTDGGFMLANATTYARQGPCDEAGIEHHLRFWPDFTITGFGDIADIPSHGWVGTRELKKRGWTDAMIERLLGPSERQISNPRYPRGAKMHQWRLATVEEVERRPEFQEMRVKAQERKAKRAAADEAKRRSDQLAQISGLFVGVYLPEKESIRLDLPGNGKAVISGDTFTIRSILKQAKFRWNGFQWEGDEDAGVIVMEAYKARKAALASTYEDERRRREAEQAEAERRRQEEEAKRKAAEEKARARRAAESATAAELEEAGRIDLAALGVKTQFQVSVYGGKAYVQGQTKPLKDYWKRWGFRWNPDSLEWYTDRIQAARDLVAALNARIETPFYVEAIGEGYGGRPRRVGDTFLSPQGPVTVYFAESDYYAEAGLSFGVGDESGHVYTHYCRKATEAEAAALMERLAAAEERKRKVERWQALKREIEEKGAYPAQAEFSDSARRVLDRQNVWGGGDWFVLDPGMGRIWYVQNNGRDGDDWSRNNVRTGGAGAIGWYVPWDDALAAELEELDRALPRSRFE